MTCRGALRPACLLHGLESQTHGDVSDKSLFLLHRRGCRAAEGLIAQGFGFKLS